MLHFPAYEIHYSLLFQTMISMQSKLFDKRVNSFIANLDATNRTLTKIVADSNSLVYSRSQNILLRIFPQGQIVKNLFS